MKELSIEEKAHRYDEAIKVAKRNYETIVQMDKDCTFAKEGIVNTFHHMFPELCESEDERIRKAIIEFFELQDDNTTYSLVPKKDILAWLEKQGEPRQHLELKAGNWYICHRAYCCRADHLTVKEGERFQCEKDGIVKGFVVKEPEKYFKECSAPATTECNYIGSDDVRRRSTIQVLEYARSLDAYNQYGKADIDKNIAWLEKQGEQKPVEPQQDMLSQEKYAKAVDECIYGEQKPADNIEPKFKVGDWVVQENIGVYKVIEVCESWYEVVDNKDKHYSIGFDKEYMCHLYTIQDANSGDVLVCKGNIKYSNGIKYERICLFNNIDNAFFTLTKTSNFVEEYDVDVNIDYPDNTIPATKEQKEILFMAMKEAGYEWDAEKKELKKFHVIDEGKDEMDYCFTKMMNSKKVSSAWSEEDEVKLKSACALIRNTSLNGNEGIEDFTIDWLKSLKDRVQPQPKQEWSEEDERTYKSIIYSFDHNYPLTIQQQEFVKSLKPQSQWKPSNEQMKALDNALSLAKNCGEESAFDLRTLYEQLKKLSEE